LLASLLAETGSLMEGLTKIRTIEILSAEADKPSGAISSQIGDGEASLVVGDILDIAAEINRLSEEIAGVTKSIDASRIKLGKEDFIRRAPAEVVEKEQARLTENEARLRRIHENIESLKRS